MQQAERRLKQETKMKILRIALLGSALLVTPSAFADVAPEGHTPAQIAQSTPERHAPAQTAEAALEGHTRAQIAQMFRK
jgi:hypothetical protein